MILGWQGAPTPLILLLLWIHCCIIVKSQDSTSQKGINDEKFGDLCNSTKQCAFEGSVCEEATGKCQCKPELPVTNHLDKCGKAVRLNEACFFDQQCDVMTQQTECRDGVCSCRFEKIAVVQPDGTAECVGINDKKFGDRCNHTNQCAFEGSICEATTGKCQCKRELPVTNHLDKCGQAVRVNETCFFDEQCEVMTPQTECRDGVCGCRFEKVALVQSDGSVECVVIQQNFTPGRYIDPAMIGILVAMFLMFITICVVLRLFSRARWRENRTIFNTPNPRLMNVSLLRENKLLHQERRGSRSSARGPSRQPSMVSLRAHSPNSQEGSRRGSRGSSNASAVSSRSNNKSPPYNMSSATTPMLESVTIEVQQPK